MSPSSFNTISLSTTTIKKISRQQILADDLTDDELAAFCQAANLAYRSGSPIVSDADYDFIYFAALKNRLPKHPLLHSVEPEGTGFSAEKTLLPEAMLSIDKAYSLAEIEKWVERLTKSALEIDLKPTAIKIKAMPKLDGFAGFDDGTHLYTRGDGKKGSDISRVFERGLSVFNNSKRGQGAGEIVVKKSYFKSNLSKYFEYPRNFQASLIKEKALDNHAKNAIKNKAALFVPFAQLPAWLGDTKSLLADFNSIVTQVLASVDFDIDGVVFEVLNASLKAKMGANRKFHRWQIAFKENKDKAQVKVISITPQVGRTGKITPVAELQPTLLSGATIMRASAHHFGMVKTQGLGVGSVIELTRSGLVIPKINKVLKSVTPQIPTLCPSCGENLVWDADFLICPNHKNCAAQQIGKMEYFFKVLANNDGFGLATIQKLYDYGIVKVSQIYALTEAEFIKIGFGKKTSNNLLTQLLRSQQEQIEDWRFLAAFGVERMGLGNSENLLKSYSLEQIFGLNATQIKDIDGFAELSAELIVSGLQSIKDEFNALNKYQFNLEKTSKTKFLKTPTQTHSLFAKKVVFTGKMRDSRGQVKKQAKSIGIQVMDAVSAKTDFLIVGSSVGQNKIQNAEKFGIKVITEAEYLRLI